MKRKELTSKNAIQMFFHCSQCLDDKPDKYSPMEWQQIEAGWTIEGLQIWCIRHNSNIIHIDFEGVKHPANTSREPKVEELN